MLPPAERTLQRSGDRQHVNVEVWQPFSDGERAAREGDVQAARGCFLDAEQAAVAFQLWRAAIRCYRHVLELDLFDREPLDRIARMPGRVTAGQGWNDYTQAIGRHPEWPRFGCRTAHTVASDQRALVTCPQVGAVLDMLMSATDLVEIHPLAPLLGMPQGMALIILRRALWPAPRDHATQLLAVRVVFAGRPPVRLDELGDWEPI
jgi:hypothetical protein